MDIKLLLTSLTSLTPSTSSTSSTSLDLGTFFQNLTNLGTTWANYFIMFLGLVLIVVAVVQLVKAFLQHGKGQVNWLMVFAMLLVGGFLLTSGFGGVTKFSSMGTKTLESIATGGSTSSK